MDRLRSSILAQPLFTGRDATKKDMLNRIRAGHNVFIQGFAGTGKSCLVRHDITAALKASYGPDPDAPCQANNCYRVTVMGTSAFNIRGVTIFSWAGIGLA